MDRTQMIQAIRDIADFLEARPELMIPSGIDLGPYRDMPEVSFQPEGAAEMRAFARHAHVPLTKDISEDFYRLKFVQPTFEGKAFEWREKVCARVLVGTETVPEHVIPAQPEQIIPAQPERVEPAQIVPKYEYRCPKLLDPLEDSALLADEEGVAR